MFLCMSYIRLYHSNCRKRTGLCTNSFALLCRRPPLHRLASKRRRVIQDHVFCIFLLFSSSSCHIQILSSLVFLKQRRHVHVVGRKNKLLTLCVFFFCTVQPTAFMIISSVAIDICAPVNV